MNGSQHMYCVWMHFDDGLYHVTAAKYPKQLPADLDEMMQSAVDNGTITLDDEHRILNVVHTDGVNSLLKPDDITNPVENMAAMTTAPSVNSAVADNTNTQLPAHTTPADKSIHIPSDHSYTGQPADVVQESATFNNGQSTQSAIAATYLVRQRHTV